MSCLLQSKRHRSEWFEGKHVAIVTDDLFELCQEVRRKAASLRHSPSETRTYLLHDRVYCARCTVGKPIFLLDHRYGKMRPTYNHTRLIAHYRCLAKERGYMQCEQGYILVNSVDNQVVRILSHLEIPDDYRGRVEQAVRNNIENEASLKHIAELEEKVKRIDFSWEQGFISPEEYLEKRHQLQQEMDAMRPVDYDDLMEAADLLVNFSAYWDECTSIEQPDEARKQLLTKIVDRIYVYNQYVIAVVLHGDFSVILDQEALAPRETINRLATLLNGK